ncbi:ring-cleaving dioxygenase [Saccharomonospora cyanea]|uniref:Lactoylglutathione lyase-like lyase n=1 Tax=Saccharomonospora cyanea NA-134 TaxID=882082 RepID=H5XEF3_9PSEU|nr:ring-cleaving dioxygenase [Saccharomonospora cyanea]EHR61421.1 lactoylglutathione lyase-like lyase [Saccharomonospora cyanea NA-134]
MTLASSGLHHVTAIAGDPQANADFYLRTLGLQLVKTTVNFDNPDVYHLYYGDEEGRPGSLLTFFPFGKVPPGRRGHGQATTTAFSVPAESIGWWRRHLRQHGTDAGEVVERDGEATLTFHDPDGLELMLVAHRQDDPRAPWDNGIVPAEHAVRGLHSVTMSTADESGTASMLEELGLSLTGQYGPRLRFAAGDGEPGALVDVLVDATAPRGLVAGGTVHHVAFRAPDDATQERWRDELVDRGEDVTEIRDRQYFRSIYFHEPGGTLLEIATDQPGFTADEPLLELGRALKLPPWLEPDREQIENGLPALSVPGENNPGVADQVTA